VSFYQPRGSKVKWNREEEREKAYTSAYIILIRRRSILDRRIIKQPHNTSRTSLCLIVSRAKPIRRYFQSFCKQFKQFVAEGMAGITEFCYGGYVCKERFGEWLVGCSVFEFADVEGSGLEGLVL
jgi:hypothetical protein